MPEPLTVAQLQDAKTMIANGNLNGFYMSSQGYGYANLGTQLVSCSLPVGLTAQKFMVQSTKEQGVNVSVPTFNQRTGLRDWIRRIVVVAGMTALVWHLNLLTDPAQAEDSPGRHSFPLDVDAKPAIGNMAGIKLAIPHNYLLSGVHYKGEEVWTPSKTVPPPRSFESEIEDFALLLRQSSLQPIETKQDWADYVEFGRTAHPRPDNRWLTVGFRSNTYALNAGTLKSVVDRYMVDDITRWGPFILQKADAYGLKHAVTKKTEKEKTSVVQADELFYDTITWHTFIRCSNHHRKVPPFDLLSHCDHLFVVPELKAVAEASYDKEILHHWREIEREIRNIAHSFVME